MMKARARALAKSMVQGARKDGHTNQSDAACWNCEKRHKTPCPTIAGEAAYYETEKRLVVKSCNQWAAECATTEHPKINHPPHEFFENIKLRLFEEIEFDTAEQRDAMIRVIDQIEKESKA